MPRPDPLPRPHPSAKGTPNLTGKLKRALRLLAWFAGLVATIASLLVTRGQANFQIHMIIATFVGMALVVFIGGALMLLIFYSAASGHDELASRHHPKDDQ